MMPNPPSPPEHIPRDPIPPDIVEWARQTFDEEQFLTHVRDIETSGGWKLEDFLSELESRVRDK
jgi:hypothetical protein